MIKRFLHRIGKTHWVHLLACICALTLITVGCGGGDGGGGSTPHLTYSGVSTPAVITPTNAQTLADGALNAGSSGTAFGGIASLTDADSVANGPSRLLLMDLTQTLRGVTDQIDFSASSGPDLSAAIETDSDSIPGSCGGNAAYNIQVDTDTGIFSGSMTFNKYCDGGVSLNGGTSFSGKININTVELESFSFNFNYITSKSGSESITMDGTIDLATTGSTLSTMMDMKIREDSTNRVYMIEGYQMDITDMGGYVSFEISGLFFHPDEGYVDLYTSTPFLVNNTDEYPNTGQLVMTGQNNTSAIVTAQSNSQCQLEVDTDGNGTYDYGPVLIDWIDL